MGRYVRVCAVSEVLPGTAKTVQVEGNPIVIFNVGGRFYGAADVCPHEGAALSAGFIEGESVTCAWHAARFHIISGRALEPPAGEKMGPPVDRGLNRYKLRVAGSDLEIEI